MLVIAQSRRPGRPKAVDAAGIQAHIIAVAQGLFFELGIAATGMEAVAKAAGITKQTLYARFPNKDELYRAVIEHIMADWRMSQGPLLGDARTLDEALHHHTVRTLETATREGSALLGHFLHMESGRNPDLAKAIIGPVRAKGIQDIEAILDAYTGPGDGDRRAAAEIFFMCLIGKINDLNTFRDEAEASAFGPWATMAVKLFLEGYQSSVTNDGRELSTPKERMDSVQ